MDKKNRVSIAKAKLLKIYSNKGEQYIQDAVCNGHAVSASDRTTIIKLLAIIRDISEKEVLTLLPDEVQDAMNAHSGLERIQYRKLSAIQNQKKQFINLKGLKEQVAMEVVDDGV
jgi:hypothetical protein